MDGKCSAAIVRKVYKESSFSENQMEFIEMSYKDEFPFEKIKEDEEIVIVDFSLQKPGEFKKLAQKTSNLLWIDHHKTAIDDFESMGLKGIRKDGVAACELTWEYFFPDIPTPQVVKFLGDYDVWKFAYGEDTNKLQVGIQLYDTDPASSEWSNWLSPCYFPNREICDGTTALKYRDNKFAELVSGYSYTTSLEGHTAIACNSCQRTSQLFNSINEDYDLMLVYIHDGLQWTVSVYSIHDEIDCSAIAKKYGGGGHKGAAGFQCKELPFKKEQIQ